MKIECDPAKLAKLPQWAQSHIRNLTHTLAEAEALLLAKNHNDVSTGRGGVGVELGYFSSNGGYSYVQTDYRTVRVGNLQVHMEDSGVTVRGHMGAIAVFPSAANSVRIQEVQHGK